MKHFIKGIFGICVLFCICASLNAQDFRGHGGHGHGGHHGHFDQFEEPDTIPQVVTLTKQEDGSILIDTSTIGGEVRGFKGRVPLIITIKDNIIKGIVSLSNRETPRFMQMASALLDKWNDKSVEEAQELQVDAVTGATFTSNAIKENVRLGLEYYQNNK